MNKVVLTGCTVEFTMPKAFDVVGINGHVKMTPAEYTTDVVIVCSEGEMRGKTIRLKKAMLNIKADLFPVMDGDGNVVLFTVDEESEKPTSAPVVAGG